MDYINTIISFTTLFVIIISAIVAYLEIKKTQEWNRRKASQDIISKTITGRIAETRKVMREEYDIDPNIENQNYMTVYNRLEDKDKRKLEILTKQLFNYMEGVSIGIKNNVLDEDMCYDHLSAFFIRYWEWGKPFIRDLKKIDSVYYIEFEHYYNKWKEEHDEQLDRIRNLGKDAI